MWTGDYGFLLAQSDPEGLCQVRYRNMSLGVFWSLLNPLVMMGVLTFVYTKIFSTTEDSYPVFVLCGLVPFSFLYHGLERRHQLTCRQFQTDQAGVGSSRELITIATVLGNCLHFSHNSNRTTIDFCSLLWKRRQPSLALAPVRLGMEVVLVCGLSLVSSAINVYVPRYPLRCGIHQCRPIFGWCRFFTEFEQVSDRYKPIYRLNPLAAIVMASWNVLLENTSPAASLLIQLGLQVHLLMLAVGAWVFHRCKRGFYDYL